MTEAIHIRPQDLAIVRRILAATLPAQARVWVFGSRAKGRAESEAAGREPVRRGADLDLAIDAGRPLTQAERLDLAEAFEESDLPFRVDVVDLATAAPAILQAVKREGVSV